jgi:uncharacterized protein (TIGR02246 family)
MTDALAAADQAAIEGIVKGLEEAWNAADAARFASAFAEDADFVNVYGMHVRGRQAILDGHQMIFRTIYAGSTNSITIKSARLLQEGIALVHLEAHLTVPQGALAGEHRALPSGVLVRGNGAWKIAAFHNTFVTGRPF